MISLKKKQSGFTIVELLIVIVVIGILALLVVNTFSGIQKKARDDSERQTDVGALSSHLEAYYTQNAKYPTLANLQDSTWVAANLKGLDPKALSDPKQTTGTIAGSAAANVYSYAVTNDSNSTCDNTPSTGTDCTKYTLTATLESGGTFTKNSL